MQKFDAAPFEAVLFDCDGVLVDSEAISAEVLRELLAARGWAMTHAQVLGLFHGKALKDLVPLIAERTGAPVTDEWMAHFRSQRDAQLRQRVKAVPHVHGALLALQARFGTRMACGSGADRVKIELQLATTGLAPFFTGRVFSGHEVPRNKPAPDVYLAAAQALGVAPGRCLVVEDSVTGVSAGLAAGATVLAYAPEGHGDALLTAGASAVISSMAELPGAMAALEAR